MRGNINLSVGSFVVSTTEHKGHDVEFWAEAATNKIVNVSSNCHPVIAEQAEAFKQSVYATILHYMKEAIKSDKTTLSATLDKQGHNDMAEIIRRL